MRKTILTKITAMLIIFAITITHYAIIGNSIVQAVAEELEEQNTIIKGNNIELDAYFDQNGIKKHEKQMQIEEKQTLYLQIAVKDKVSISHVTIKIEDANFNIIKDEIEKSTYIGEVNEESNEIEINNISSNNTVLLEIPIKFKQQEKISQNYFEKEINITAKGTYKTINQEEKELEGQVKIKPIWTTNSETQMAQTIEKYLNLGENGILIQQKIETEVINNTLPRKAETIQTKAIEINEEKPEKVTVLINGENTDESEIQYNKEKGIVEINYKNEEIDWTTPKIEYTIIYKYNKNKEATKQKVNIETKVKTELYAKNEAIQKEEAKEGIINPIGSIVSTKTELEGEIYKGYLYENEAKEIEYKEKNTLETSYIDGIEKIQLTTNDYKYIDENQQAILKATNISYKQTKINKKELTNVLGESGTISIKRENNEVIAVISSQTEADEEGYATINYAENEKAIIIETSKPEKIGKITIINTKAINGETNIKRAIIKQIKQVAVNTQTITNITNEIATASVELKEPTTEAKIEISKNSYSTLKTTKNVEIKATLKSNLEKYDLYKNPSITIELPADVVDINVNSINKIYGDEFTDVKAAKGIVEGKNVIKIDLIGEQTTHKEIGVEGTMIVIDVDLELNNKATTKQDTIKMTYTNQKATQYKEEQATGIETIEVEIVSPKGLITTNNIQQLGIETIGEEAVITQQLEKNSVAKQIKVESEIINNNENPIQNVVVIGNFGTDGKVEVEGETKENNLQTELKTALNVTGIDTSKIQVYYSQNENASQDLNDSKNQWTETITDAKNTKKYMIAIPEMQKEETIQISYDEEIPANLEYNQQAYQVYRTFYTESATGVEKEVVATAIETTTGTGPVLEGTITAKVGTKQLENGQTVKQGETIKYIAEIENKGTEDATNIVVTSEVTIGSKKLEEDNKQTIESLKSGEKRTIEFEISVDKNIEINTEIIAKLIIKYGEVIKETEAIKAIVEEGKISINLQYNAVEDQDNSIENEVIPYKLTIENISNKEIRNIKLKYSISENIKIHQQFIKYNNNEDAEEIENSEEIVIESIPVEGKVEIALLILTKEIQVKSEMYSLRAIAILDDKEYNSNEETGKIKTYNNYEVSLSANNENEYIKPGETIEYTIVLKNNNEIEAGIFLLKDEISNRLTIQKITENDKEIDLPKNNEVSIPISFEKEETKVIKITTIVNYKENAEKEKITNKAILVIDSLKEFILETNEIEHTIANGGDISTDQDGNAIYTYRISGTAWEDENQDGERQDNEKILSGINVNLLNIETNQLAIDNNNETITATTDNDGSYELKGINNGEYIVVFEYNTAIYRITEYQKQGVESSRNSKALSKQMTINGQQKTYGVTDTVKINDNNMANINIGLIATGIFDLKLDKYINKINVKTSKGTKTYNYNNASLAKVEVDAKLMEGTTVEIEYEIKVTNMGEVAGYAKTIADYMPNDLKFDKNLNANWGESGSILSTNALEKEIINPGESKEVKLVLTKVMNKNNTGTVNNVAEIAEDYNEQNISDINSTPGNKLQGENDMSSAEVIISVKTGMILTYTIILIFIITGIILFLKKYLI